MKKISFIALSALPVLGLVSCGEKEAPATPVSTEAKAETPAAKTLTTAEDYMVAVIETVEALAAAIEATTPENSAAQAKVVSELGKKMVTLIQEAEAKGFTKTDPSPELNARMSAAQEKMETALLTLVQSENFAKLDPSFMQAIEGIGN